MLWKGIRGEIFPYPTPSSCQQSCWWGMGLGVRAWGLGMSCSVLFCPLQLEPHGTQPSQQESPRVSHLLYLLQQALGTGTGLCSVCQPGEGHAGVGGNLHTACCQTGGKLHTMWSSFLSGLERLARWWTFQCPPAGVQWQAGSCGEAGAQLITRGHHSTLHWSSTLHRGSTGGRYSCALCTFARSLWAGLAPCCGEGACPTAA